MIYWVSAQEISHPDICQIGPLTALAILRDSKYIGWDTETTGLTPFYNKPILEIFSNDVHEVVIDLRTIKYEDLQHIHEGIAHIPWIAHNAKFDYKMLMWHYPELPLGLAWDTQIATMILYNGYNIGGFSLRNLTEKLLNVKLSKEVRNSFIGKEDTTPFSIQEIIYAAKDTRYLRDLMEIEQEKGKMFDYEELFKLEMQVTKVLAKMELKGFNFDKEAWSKAAKEGEELLLETQIQLDEIVNELSRTYKSLISAGLTKVRYKGADPEAYNKYTSSDTLLKIFEATGEIEKLPLREDFEEYKAKKVNRLKDRRNKGNTVIMDDNTVYQQGSLFSVRDTEPKFKPSEKYKLGQAELENFLKADINHVSPLREFVKELLRFRKLSKTVTTYGTSFLNCISKDGRARTQFSQVYTATGRLSSSSYNINNDRSEGYNAQNIPQSKILRQCFKADKGYMIATIDYSGQEITIAASQSKDPVLIKNVTEGLDIHSLLATETFRLITGNNDYIVSKTENASNRNDHKPILFGLFYGAGPRRVSDILDVKRELAVRIYNRIREMLPDFFKYQDKVQEFALEHNYIDDHSKYKRRRWFTSDTPEHKIRKQASNFPMQSTGASMIKEAIIKTDEYLQTFKEKYPDICVIGTVHDEILFQIPKDRKDIAYKCMEIMKEVGNTYLEDLDINASMEWMPHWTK